jgi:hypothetical protein
MDALINYDDFKHCAPVFELPYWSRWTTVYPE